MRKFAAVTALLLTVAGIIWLGLGWRQNSKRDAAFEHTAIGDTEAQIIGRFGAPDYREPVGRPYMRYTGAACVAPCQTRLWWEDALLPGIGAWSVELGADRRVVNTTRWVSP
jgi:hypothetical protein